MLKVGALVGWKEKVGLVLGCVRKAGAKTGDVWVSWAGDLKPRWEHGPLLEVLSESR